MRYENGALGTFMASSCAPGASKSGARGTRASGNRIYGTAGQIVFEDGNLLVYSEQGVDGLTPGEWTTLSFPQEQFTASYANYIQRFAHAIQTHHPPDVPAEEGRKTLQVLLAAYRSGETHQPVALD